MAQGISIHVVDVSRGVMATGMQVELWDPTSGRVSPAETETTQAVACGGAIRPGFAEEHEGLVVVLHARQADLRKGVAEEHF